MEKFSIVVFTWLRMCCFSVFIVSPVCAFLKWMVDQWSPALYNNKYKLKLKCFFFLSIFWRTPFSCGLVWTASSHWLSLWQLKSQAFLLTSLQILSCISNFIWQFSKQTRSLLNGNNNMENDFYVDSLPCHSLPACFLQCGAIKLSWTRLRGNETLSRAEGFLRAEGRTGGGRGVW